MAGMPPPFLKTNSGNSRFHVNNEPGWVAFSTAMTFKVKALKLINEAQFQD